MSVPDTVLRLDTPEYTQDPHALHAELRRAAPVREAIFPRGFKGWLVTAYDDAKVALTDPRISKGVAGFAPVMDRHRLTDATPLPFRVELATHMLNSDPPDHTRLRKLVTKAFTSRVVGRLRDRVEGIADGLLDAMAGRDTVDLLDDYAFPLPITVISELLGVPEADRDDFRSWTSTMITTGPPEVTTAAGDAMGRYLAELIEHKRREPAEDLLSDLVGAHDDGDRLSSAELVSMAMLLLIAGHETTVNLIGNGVLALLRNPDQLAALRADPALLPGAVEEFLRFEGPINIATMRYTTAPITLGGVEVPEGEFVMVSLVSANRDEAHTDRPDRLDITRAQSAHLAFGHGIHYCVGAPLARLEAATAIGRLLDRFPALSLAADPEELRWRDSTLVRGLETLPVKLT
ncbi:putative cytochrome P450 hydroxylase [Actinokineospora spheciospongiae]|uniref:Putative cytochrome P450 hydroxylase n=1 Tax=Actinokineospora spheciospongiae TaxID=909613 RepID=W7J1V0_9PSEU|nr:cytochrome P450 [Actinokineospora spheciospongiae]EWC63042.1 putative cytochrome P450 hydroxylase [Actinokineospora spheciospongiae]PWW62597.1 cytochrome P450 [Actinokineospora spheciospongiae]